MNPAPSPSISSLLFMPSRLGRLLASTVLGASAIGLTACAVPAGPGAGRESPTVPSAGITTGSANVQSQMEAYETASKGTSASVSRTDDQQIRIDIPSEISFDVGRSAVKSVLAGLLTRYAAVARAHPDTTITIVGHTDSSGSAAANTALSRDRAQSTRDYLIARGVAITRLRTEGRGSAEPIADNGTPEGRATNRRVTLFIAPTQAARSGT
jgi:outer membrane protein OmpA-like peptidoglycan-associated protein